MKTMNEMVNDAVNRVLEKMNDSEASLVDLSKALDSIVAAYKATGNGKSPETPFSELRDKIRAVE